MAPEDTVYAVSVLPAVMLTYDKSLTPLAEKLVAQSMIGEANVSLSKIAQAIAFIEDSKTGRGRMVIRTMNADTCKRLVTRWIRGMDKVVDEHEPPTWSDGHNQVIQLDSITMIVDHLGPNGEGKAPPLYSPLPSWASEWRERDLSGERHIIAACDVRKLLASIPQDARKKLLGGYPIQMVAPVLEHLELGMAGLEVKGRFQNNKVKNELHISADFFSDSDQSAQQAADTLKALLLLGKNVVSSQQELQRNPVDDDLDVPPPNPLMEQLLELAEHFLANAQVEANGKQANLTYVSEEDVAEVAQTAARLLPSVEAARAAARRNQSINNLKQLALAMHNFHYLHQRFPAASSREYYDYEDSQWKDSKHPHSWRVDLLQFLEGMTLYKEYRFEEPWDSEANKRILDQMPDVYRDPNEPAGSTNSSYFVLTGPEAIFYNEKGTSFREIVDGTSFTLLIVEAKRDIPWTKPEDIPVSKDKELPELGGHYEGMFLAASADGYVRAYSSSIDPATLWKMITRAGREVFDPPADPLKPGK